MSDLPLIKGVVSDILTQQGQAAQYTASAAAQGIYAQGYQAEAGAYGSAQQIAQQNAALAGVAGDVQAAQEARKVVQTVGSQRAQIAAAGFANSGSALDLSRSSMQQGHLADQLIRTQTAINQGGFLEQGAAAQAETAAVSYASQAALTLQQQQAAAGVTATTSAANETKALIDYLHTTTTGATPAGRLALSTLTGPNGQPLLTAPDATVAPTFTPTGTGIGVGTGGVAGLGAVPGVAPAGSFSGIFQGFAWNGRSYG